MRGCFVTATDTGVGKTTVACALVAAFARTGKRVGVMKPCETGGGDDAERLIAATGRSLPPSDVRPYAFPLPAAPEVAAQAAGARIDLALIMRAFTRLSASSDLLVVEGAGGLLVPLTDTLSMADLAVRLALPLLIVARPSLGTINHTLLTLEAARRRDLQVLGVIFSRATEAAPGPDEPFNPDTIARRGDVAILGTLPYLPPGTDLAAAAVEHLDLAIINGGCAPVLPARSQ